MKRFAALLLRRDRRMGETVVEECRRCGKTTELAETPCEACGSEEVVRYTIR